MNTETKMVIIPMAFGRTTAVEIKGRTFKTYDEFIAALKESAKVGIKQCENEFDVDDFIDDVEVYSLDEFVYDMNESESPLSDNWLTYVNFETEENW